MTKEHRYKVDLRWTGDDGVGTAAYNAYSRTYDLPRRRQGHHRQLTVAPGSDSRKAESLHEAAGRMCFIERTLNCQVACEPTITLSAG